MESNYPNSSILDSSKNALKLYSNVEEITGATIALKRDTKKTKCFKIKTMLIQ